MLRKAPCKKCPYKLGQVQPLANPCPQCKENGYKTYDELQKHLSKGESVDIKTK